MAGNFFDTNVLVYVASGDAAKAEKALRTIALGGTVSVQVLNELTNVARRKMGLSWEVARAFVFTIRQLVSVVPLTLETHERGLYIGERYGLSVYDAMIVAAAVLADADVLFSEDMQNGAVIEGVRIENPFTSPA